MFESLANLSRRAVVAISLEVTVMCLGVLLSTIATTGQEQELQERMIEKKSDFDPPINIILVKTKKGEVKTGKKFLDNDDWLRSLIVNINNTSSKTVTYIDVEVLFRRPEGQKHEPPLVHHLTYGRNPSSPEESVASAKPIAPGETVDIAMSDTDYDGLEAALGEAKYPVSVKRIEIRILEIGFDDGTLWSGGNIYRRDPNGGKGWSLVEQPQGSVQNRTSFFCKQGLVNLMKEGIGNSLSLHGLLPNP